MKKVFLHSTRLFVFFCLLCLVAYTAADAQPFPAKPIRILTTEAGGGNDIIARYIAQGISGPLGQPVIVENRGGSILILARALMSSPPDGYTLLFGTGTIWVQSLLEKVPYDPVADFTPVCLVSRAPNVLVVHPSVPVKNVAELIALAKAKPGKLNYASGIDGSAVHIASELFKAMTGANIVRVVYKGMGPALIATAGGEAEVMFSTAIGVPPYLQSGKLKALAVTSPDRFAMMPDLPTVAQTVPGYEAGVIQGFLAPAKTPAVVLTRLNEEIVRFLKTPGSRERFLSQGADIVGSSPEEFAAVRRADMARVAKVIEMSGLRETK